MPNSITKNYISEENLRKMIHTAFPLVEIQNITELSEGFFNIAYLIQFENNEEVILKIAPDPILDVMTHEKNIMYAEVTTMELLRKEKNLPIPNVLFHDFTKTICPSDYFFMEKLEGGSFISKMSTLSKEACEHIQEQIGVLNREIHEITNDMFGYFAQEEKQQTKWYPVFQSMLEDVMNDAKRKNVEMPIAKDQLLEALSKDSFIFEEVTTPKLVHWDLWAGNIFIDGDTITGIIDFERCLWGDGLMEEGFRTFSPQPAFIKGYGITLSESMKRRVLWYDLYFAGIVCLEYDYRGYDTKDGYYWGVDIFKTKMRELGISE